MNRNLLIITAFLILLMGIMLFSLRDTFGIKIPGIDQSESSTSNSTNTSGNSGSLAPNDAKADCYSGCMGSCEHGASQQADPTAWSAGCPSGCDRVCSATGEFSSGERSQEFGGVDNSNQNNTDGVNTSGFNNDGTVRSQVGSDGTDQPGNATNNTATRLSSVSGNCTTSGGGTCTVGSGQTLVAHICTGGTTTRSQMWGAPTNGTYPDGSTSDGSVCISSTVVNVPAGTSATQMANQYCAGIQFDVVDGNGNWVPGSAIVADKPSGCSSGQTPTNTVTVDTPYVPNDQPPPPPPPGTPETVTCYTCVANTDSMCQAITVNGTVCPTGATTNPTGCAALNGGSCQEVVETTCYQCTPNTDDGQMCEEIEFTNTTGDCPTGFSPNPSNCGMFTTSGRCEVVTPPTTPVYLPRTAIFGKEIDLLIFGFVTILIALVTYKLGLYDQMYTYLGIENAPIFPTQEYKMRKFEEETIKDITEK